MKKQITRSQKKDLTALVALPDAQIDTGDIPEIRSLAGGVPGLFYRPAEPTAIQLSTPDATAARLLSKTKGVPYQKANTVARRSGRRH